MLPMYAASRVPGLPVIVTFAPFTNVDGRLEDAVAVTVTLVVGVAPVHDVVCVKPPAAIVAEADGSAVMVPVVCGNAGDVLMV